MQEGQGRADIPELEPLSLANVREREDTSPSSGKELHSQPTAKQLEIHVGCASIKVHCVGRTSALERLAFFTYVLQLR